MVQILNIKIPFAVYLMFIAGIVCMIGFYRYEELRTIPYSMMTFGMGMILGFATDLVMKYV